MKTVITYGTFDLFHVGHVRLLRRVRELGDRVVVGCSTDAFNTLKGKKTLMPFDQRVEILSSCRYVDAVFPEESWDQKRDDILREGAQILAIGHDWAGKFDDLADICDVVYLPRTDGVSTTGIRSLVRVLQAEKLNQIRAVAKDLDRLLREL